MRHAILLVAVLLSAASASTPPPAQTTSSQAQLAELDHPAEPVRSPPVLEAIQAAANKPVSEPLTPVSRAAPAGRLPAPLLGANPWLAACEAGQMRECLAAGRLLREQQPAEEELVEGVWQRGCDAGDVADCHRVSLFAHDMVRCAELNAKACMGDVFEACYFLALVILPMPDSQQASSRLFARSCTGGVPEGCLEVARTAEGSPAVTDHERALVHYARACKLGEDLGCQEAQRMECQLGRRTGDECVLPASDGDVGGELGGMVGGELGGVIVAPPPPPAK